MVFTAGKLQILLCMYFLDVTMMRCNAEEPISQNLSDEKSDSAYESASNGKKYVFLYVHCTPMHHFQSECT